MKSDQILTAAKSEFLLLPDPSGFDSFSGFWRDGFSGTISSRLRFENSFRFVEGASIENP